MLTTRTVKTYSIPITGFTLDYFCDFIEYFNIDLGCHLATDAYHMKESWPYLEWCDDYGWGLTYKPSMEVLPQIYRG